MRCHLFSFVNAEGERMYFMVVNALNVNEARKYRPAKFTRYHGLLNHCPKAAYDADVYVVR